MSNLNAAVLSCFAPRQVALSLDWLWPERYIAPADACCRTLTSTFNFLVAPTAHPPDPTFLRSAILDEICFR